MADIIRSGKYYYSKSSNIKVFPCAWRGQCTTTEGGTETTNYYDIEARLNTEYNFTNLSGAAGDKNNIVSPVEGDEAKVPLVFYIAGYRFTLDSIDGLPTTGTIYAFIKTVSTQLYSDSKLYTTTILNNIKETEQQPLDQIIGSDTCFCGLAFSTTEPTGANVKYIRLMNDDSYCKSAYLPKIGHGDGEYSVYIGTGATANGNNSLAIGVSAKADGKDCIGLGKNITINNAYSGDVLIGNGLKAGKNNQVLIGSGGTCDAPITDDIAIISNGTNLLSFNTTAGATSALINNVDSFTIKNKSGNPVVNVGCTATNNDIVISAATTKYHGGVEVIDSSLTGDASKKIELTKTVANYNVPIVTTSKIATTSNDGILVGTCSEAEGVRGLELRNTGILLVGGEAGENSLLNMDNSAISLVAQSHFVFTVKGANQTDLFEVNAGTGTDNSAKFKIEKDITTISTSLDVANGIECHNNDIKHVKDISFGEGDYDGAYIKAIDGSYEIKATTFWATSDRRAKENITEYSSQKSILDLPVYKYDYIKGPKNQIGCMAQDLLEICPEVVHEEQSGMLSVDNSKVVYLLLNEVKKLRNELNELKVK